MKKTITLVMLAMILLLAACGQGGAAKETPQGGEAVQLANPWRDITEEEAKAFCPRSFAAPEGAGNAVWSVLESAADPSGLPGALVQLSFDLDGLRFTAREQATGEKEVDQSGMYYEWTVQDQSTLNKWGGGELACSLFRYFGEDGYADLCTWHDPESGVSYSLSVAAADLDGFDIRAVAEALYAP